MGREMRKQVKLDASPEQVWEAIATGQGITAWFVPTELEPRTGGTMRQVFGPGAGDVTGRITAYEAGHRIAYGAAEPPAEGADYAFEFLVEGRDGGGAVLRFVQSGFLDGDGWDAEYSSFDKGWDLFFGNLRAYLAHFAGRPATAVTTMAWTEGSKASTWPKLLDGLGLPAVPALGDAVTLAPEGPAPISGVVDVSTPEFLGVRSSNGLHRIGAEGDQGCGVSAFHYFYGEPVDGAGLTDAWQQWLSALFPMPGDQGQR